MESNIGSEWIGYMSYLSMHKTRLGSVLCMAHMAPFQLANSPLTRSPTAERRKPFHILTGRTVPFGLAACTCQKSLVLSACSKTRFGGWLKFPIW